MVHSGAALTGGKKPAVSAPIDARFPDRSDGKNKKSADFGHQV
jgi:hypothetical protein